MTTTGTRTKIDEYPFEGGDGGEMVKALRKDLKAAAVRLKDAEARFFVDTYYQLQSNRIRAANRRRAAGEAGEPNSLEQLVTHYYDTIENICKSALDTYSRNSITGRWLRSICGVGPVIAAGLRAYIDIDKAPHPGSILRFAGYVPGIKWRSSEDAAKLVRGFIEEHGGVNADSLAAVSNATGMRIDAMNAIARRLSKDKDDNPEGDFLWNQSLLTKVAATRPWNAKLKLLLWKLSDCQVKLTGNPNAYYANIYVRYKALYTDRNDRGEYAEQAARTLEERGSSMSKDQKAAYKAGRLPKGRIDLRARRIVSVRLINDLWIVAKTARLGYIPDEKPWVIDIGGHNDYDPPPGLDWVEKEARTLIASKGA